MSLIPILSFFHIALYIHECNFNSFFFHFATDEISFKGKENNRCFTATYKMSLIYTHI